MNDDETGKWTRFWTRGIDGQPLWFLAAMAAVPFYLGLLVESLGYGDAVLPAAVVVLIAVGGYFLWASVRGDKRL